MKSTNRFDDLTLLAERSKTEPIWLRVGQLIDGVSDAPTRNADVVFDALGIRSVRAGIEGRAAPDAILSDCTLLPCLIESHAHLFLDGAPIDLEERKRYLTRPASWMLPRARGRWNRILECGVGAVRDAGDRHGVGLALAAERKAEMGRLASSPWIDSPGAAIHHRGRYGSFMAEPIEDFASLNECVAARVAAGADRIKLLVSGIINFEAGQVTSSPQMTADEVAALVSAAGSHGRRTFAHASGTDGVENSIAGGVGTIEHGFFVTPEQLARMRDRQIGWVPTFAPVQVQIDLAAEFGWNQNVVANLQRIIDLHRGRLRLASEIGVKLIAGSDAGSCGVPHGIGFLRELCHMESAGLSPMAVLRAATGVSAQALQFPEPIGQIAPGFRSRFILTRHDPLATVANLQKEKVIVFDGVAIESTGDIDLGGL
ncbi:MAG TPA: amidohydrolase family protein [Tepidisphaeraceae bacterium]|nr:amidohydrolase family protein [Tepidisphaeraceae bacterium]